jgi:hypothetical protein
MKTILTLTTALLAFAAQAQAHTIPDGTFRGEGLWKSPADRGGYEVITTVAGERISSVYKIRGGENIETAVELKNGENGFLRVISEGKEVGSGYCLEKVALCHYSLKTDKLSLEETLTIQDGKLYAFGSKTQSGVTVMWQEKLEK